MKIFNHICVIAALVLILAMAAPVSAQESDALKAVFDKARAAGVENEVLNQVLMMGLENRLSPEQTAGFMETLIALNGDKLPLQPFIRKMEEGLAKKVRMELIHSALNKKREEYLFVNRELLLLAKRWEEDGDFPLKNVTAGLADLLASGVAKEELRDYLETIPKSDWNAVLSSADFLAILRQSGVERNKASELAVSGLRNGYFEDGDLSLAQVVVAARKKSKNPEDINSILANGLGTKQNLNELCLALGLTPSEAFASAQPNIWYGKNLNSRKKKLEEPIYNSFSSDGMGVTVSPSPSSRGGSSGSGGQGRRF